jgi:hypothetical protein
MAGRKRAPGAQTQLLGKPWQHQTEKKYGPENVDRVLLAKPDWCSSRAAQDDQVAQIPGGILAIARGIAPQL